MMDTHTTPQEDRIVALLTHLGGIFFGFIPSLIVWLIKKDDNAFVATHAKEALNFQITMLIAFAIAYLLVLVLIGIFLIWLLAIANLVLCIVAGVKAYSGESYRYPFALRLIR